MRIVVDKDIPFLDGVLGTLAKSGGEAGEAGVIDMVALKGDAIDPNDVRDADALLVRTRTRCNSALLTGSKVRFIGTATVGADHIDTAWCASQGITVATAAGSNSRGVLQWVAAALAWLAETKNIQPANTTLGVVGVGHVGSLVARYARNWGFDVMCSDPPRERAEGFGTKDGFFPLAQLAARCDIITFHVPLTDGGFDATCGLVNRDFLSAARPNAVIVNASRGPIIEKDVTNRADFILDTWNNEPDIDPDLLSRALIATPHIAGYSLQGKAAATAMIVNELARCFGLPLPGIPGLDGSKNVNGGIGGVGAKDWWPEGVPRSNPRDIGWDEMRVEMPRYFDIAAQSDALKSAPGRFEAMRDNYNYRLEFF
jgi:erythronate-4-phosphate dehydrogenase